MNLYAVWELTKYYFLSGSNLYTSVTGGWTASKSCTHSYCSVSTTRAGMSLGYKGDYAQVCTVNKIDLTNYNKIYFTYNINNNCPSANKICNYWLGISSSATLSQTPFSGPTKQITDERTDGITSSDDGVGTTYLDVSNITGSYYIKIYTNHNSNETWYNFWAYTTDIYATY